LRQRESKRYLAGTVHKFAREDTAPRKGRTGVPGNDEPPPTHHRLRGRLVAINVGTTLVKVMGLVLGIALLALLAAMIVAGIIIGLASLLLP
jgi:hypothetical protein